MESTAGQSQIGPTGHSESVTGTFRKIWDLKPKVVYWKYSMALSMSFKCFWVFNGSDMSNSLIGREKPSDTQSLRLGRSLQTLEKKCDFMSYL
jgi:hypothetical protein